MRFMLQLSDLASIKPDLAQSNPWAQSSRRIEGAARGLGFNTYAGLRTFLSEGPREVEANDEIYAEYVGYVFKDHEPARFLSRALSRIMVRKVLETQPQLTGSGFDSALPRYAEDRKMTFAERKAALEDRRKDTLSDWSMDQFELACIYLRGQERRKTINYDFGSYGLKHRAEDLSRKLGKHTHLGNYVSNGMLIISAYALGFSVKRAAPDSLNAFLNISSKTVRATAAHPVPTLTQLNAIIGFALGV